PLGAARFLQIATDLVDALIYAHDQTPPLVHGALGPSSVLVDEFDAVRVADFGLAADPRDVDLLEPRGREFQYRAPEVCMGEFPSPRSDLYSLGALFYAMAGGRPPLAGSELVLLFEQVNRSFSAQPLAALDQEVPGLAKITLDCLQKDPADRPKSAREVAARLELAFSGATRRQSEDDAPGLFRRLAATWFGRTGGQRGRRDA
ncbi:MAG: protein kinase, partial [Planctomycetes bacterium]|nr:protein kinase [Planctomycetota bacterium]